MSHLLSRALFAVQAGPPHCQLSAAISRRAVRWRMRQPLAQRTRTRLTATPNRGSGAAATQLPEVYIHHNRRNRSAVSGPACRLRCRPTALAPPNRLLRKLLAAEGLPRAARRRARNPPGLRPLGHARPPTRTHRHLGAASHRARSAGEADPDRTPAPVVHQIGVQTQGLPTVCCLCTTQSAGLQRLGRAPHEQFLGCRAEQLGAPRLCGSLTALAGTRARVDQDHRPSSTPRDLLVRLAKLGLLVVKLPSRASTPDSVSWLRFSSRTLRCFPGFALGHRIIPERGRWSLATPVLRWLRMPNGESLLNIWFAAVQPSWTAVM
jgi:hypothetical protein